MTSDREPVWRYSKAWASVFVCLLFFADSHTAVAQLQITEVMYHPLDDDVWEWVELRNTDLISPIDLDGAYLDSLGDPRILGGTPANIDAGQANNTVVPAGGTVVLYNGEAPGIPDLASGDQVFRDAWGLDPNVTPLIAVSNFPSLPSTGSSLGIWSNFGDYEADLVETTPGQFVVGGFDNSLVGLDFRTNFPTPGSGSSIYWNGAGSNANGLNWSTSIPGAFGAQTSVPAFFGSGSINSTNDLANPGIIPNIPEGNEIIITEMMIDPASTEPDWEWIEIYNGGAPIDFSVTGFVFDDHLGNDLDAPNITSGMIESGGVAVLFNADAITKENMITAWGDDDPNAINFIPVTNFPSLDNADFTIGLWSSYGDYSTDSAPLPDPGRAFLETVTTLNFNSGTWPTSVFGRESIYLIDLEAEQNNAANWEVSDPNYSEDPNSYFADPVSGGTEIHAGGDIGSPGTFDPNAADNDADFDNDGLVTGLDFLIWQQGFEHGTTNATGDTNGDANVNNVDLAVWEAQYPLITADVNNDGRVDGLDFLAWQTGAGGTTLLAWEAMYGAASIAPSIATVPEPTQLASLCMLVVFSSRFRRRVLSPRP